MKLSKNAEKVLLAAYKQANGENCDIGSNSLNILGEDFKKVYYELTGSNENRIEYLTANLFESLDVDDPICTLKIKEFKNAGKEYVEKNLK